MLTCFYFVFCIFVLYVFYISFRFSVFYLILLEAFDLLLLLLHSLPPSYAERKQEDLLSRCNAHSFFSFFKNKFILFIYLFIYLFLSTLGLHCCMRAFSSCSERGLLFIVVCGLSHCGGFSCYGAWALGVWASVVVCRLSSCGLRALERRLSSCGAQA